MNAKAVRELLLRVRDGDISPEAAAQRLAALPYEDVGFAKIDHHRDLRTGLPEVIYAAGKTDAQVAGIFARLAAKGSNVLATRVATSAAEAVLRQFPAARHSAVARTLSLRQQETSPGRGRIAIICAGTSDLPVAEEAAETAALLGRETLRLTDVGVAGLHRLLAYHEELQQADVLIVCAGMEGALPSVVAGLVRAPVIAVPTSVGYGASFGGVAALLGMLNACSPHIGVVNIDNGFGAACLAHSILNVGAGGL